MPTESVQRAWQRFLVVFMLIAFVAFASIIVAFEDIFVDLNPIRSLQVGDLAPQDIAAPVSDPFVSEILTNRARDDAESNVLPVYDPPDPDVARQQNQLTQQILEYIVNVRRDPYGTTEQKINDLNAITALTLNENIATNILRIEDEETWNLVEDEILNVLARVMRESIREDELNTVRSQLRNQVSVRFDSRERGVIVAIVEDLVRPNTFENVEETATSRQGAAASVDDVRRSFVRGESIVNEGEIIDDEDFEALRELGLLRVSDRRNQEIGRAVLASIVVLVMMGVYLARFQPRLLYEEGQLLMLCGALFLITLAAARFVGVGGNIYVFPAAALALVYVAIAGAQLAVISSLSLGMLVGLIANNSLEVATLIVAGSIAGVVILRRAERLNTFFVAGIVVGVINCAIVTIFNIASPATLNSDVNIIELIVLAFIGGALLGPAVAITMMYILTTLFNLTTALKLADLAQPNKPLLQRLLREAPGTYQHSLMVGNLTSQAANAIGADAQLSQVAALYHDIGKMENPLFFAENQQGISNPHDTLNDPYRSADIIISHATEGDDMARQYGLPGRIRDFIREHHGNTQVYVFYQRAVAQAGDDKSAVDIADFTYPGPKPQSRETAIMMMADSCESAVRAAKPQSKQEIAQIVGKIIDSKREQGQLDESGLTLGDLRTVKRVFVDVLQGVFHPRVNYQQAVRQEDRKPAEPAPRKTEPKPPKPKPESEPAPVAEKAPPKIEKQPEKYPEDEESPLTEVPRLPSADERRTTGSVPSVKLNGARKTDEQAQVQEAEDGEKVEAKAEEDDEGQKE